MKVSDQMEQPTKSDSPVGRRFGFVLDEGFVGGEDLDNFSASRSRRMNCPKVGGRNKWRISVVPLCTVKAGHEGRLAGRRPHHVRPSGGAQKDPLVDVSGCVRHIRREQQGIVRMRPQQCGDGSPFFFREFAPGNLGDRHMPAIVPSWQLLAKKAQKENEERKTFHIRFAVLALGEDTEAIGRDDDGGGSRQAVHGRAAGPNFAAVAGRPGVDPVVVDVAVEDFEPAA